MTQLLSALIVDADLDGRLETARALQAIGLEVAGQAAYGTEAGFLASQQRPNVILLALEHPAARGLATLESLQRLAPDTPVVVYSSVAEPALLRRAMRQGARDFLHRPLDADDLREAVFTALSQEEQRQLARWSEPSVERARGSIVAVASAKGGVGKSTLAANLAVRLRLITGHEVSLVDVDAQFGQAALDFDLDTDGGLAELVAGGDLGRGAVAGQLRRHHCGVELLAAPLEPAAWAPLRPEQVAAIAQSLAERDEYVLLDTPPLMHEATPAALHEAATVLLVTSLELASVRNTKAALRLLESWSIPAERVQVVVNDVTRARDVTARDAANATGLAVTLCIPYEPRVSRLAQAGRQAALALPHSAFTRAIDDLARRLAGVPETTARRRRSGRALPLLRWAA